MRFFAVAFLLFSASCPCGTPLPMVTEDAPPPPSLPVGWDHSEDELPPPTQDCDATLLEGWSDELPIASTGRASPAASCATFPASDAIICVIEMSGADAGVDLHQLRSYDSGRAWTTPERVTNDGADEHGPHLIADGVHGDMKLAYSIAGVGDDLVLRTLSCAECVFSSASNILADGGRHVDASLVALDDGVLLALEQHGSGVRVLRSDDGGAAWSTPQSVIDEPLAVGRPVAVQQGGWIQLVFHDPNHGPTAVIGEIWSADGGLSWVEHDVVYDAGTDIDLSFAGVQMPGNVTLLATIDGRAHHMTSWDGGLSFDGPYATSLRSPTAAAAMAMGPWGPAFIYADAAGDGIFARRYHWGCP
jgi:hypothetical protein